MIRHIELVKVVEFHDSKSRNQQLEEISAFLKELVDNLSGVLNYQIKTRTSLDPMDADLLLMIDFEDREALKEYDLDMNRVEWMFKLGEQAESFLAYDYEI